MKLIKTIIFLFLISFTTHAFGKSNEYYRTTLLHIVTECSSECQKFIIEKEIKYLIYEIIEKLLKKLELELLEKRILTVNVNNVRFLF